MSPECIVTLLSSRDRLQLVTGTLHELAKVTWAFRSLQHRSCDDVMTCTIRRLARSSEENTNWTRRVIVKMTLREVCFSRPVAVRPVHMDVRPRNRETINRPCHRTRLSYLRSRK